MAKTNLIGAQRLVRCVDEEVNKPLTPTGHEDMDATDYLKVTGNGATRKVVLEASNDDEDNVSLELRRKGTGAIILNLPTTDPSVAGALWSDSGTVKVSAG